MIGIEVAGLVLSLAVLLSGGELSAPTRRHYGYWYIFCLRVLLPQAIRIMARVESDPFIENDEKVTKFIEAHTASFGMIGVAGAIIAQVAITAFSLPNLTESHWTAAAFCIASLVTGTLSVFFSCAMSPALHGMHEAHDIRLFLLKPTPSILADKASAYTLPTTSDAGIFANPILQVPSVSAAIMLIAPVSLLKVALGSLLIGLGIYLGEAYTSKLFTAFGTETLGILITFVVVTALGLAMYYIPMVKKAIELRTSRSLEREMNRQRGKAAAAANQAASSESPGIPIATAGLSQDGTIEAAFNRLVQAQESSLQASRDLLASMGSANPSEETR